MKNIIAIAALVVSLATIGLVLYKTNQAPQPFGATSTQVTDGDCLFINGAHLCAKSVTMANASSTCSFLSPAATSTFRGTATINNSFGGSFAVGWGKDNNMFSTTTSLGYKPAAIASGDSGTFTATSTAWSGSTLEDVTTTIAPSTWVNFKVGSSSPTLTGKCFGEFAY